MLNQAYKYVIELLFSSPTLFSFPLRVSSSCSRARDDHPVSPLLCQIDGRPGLALHHLRLPRRHHLPLCRLAEGQDQPGEGRVQSRQAVRGVDDGQVLALSGHQTN